MPDDRTVLDHLLEGRDALVLEVKRLSTAIDELDAVIGQIGGGRERLGNGAVNGNGASNGASSTAVAPDQDAVTESVQLPDEPVNPPVEVEPVAAVRAAKARPPRKATPRKSGTRRAGSRPTESPKSIRVHVLEMLAAEDRDFGLAEIIDRVHGAGIQAHDDAVRSITIKLMKDGRVERVGRGQYRLSQRGSARHAMADAAASAAAAQQVAASDDSIGNEAPADGPDAATATAPDEQNRQPADEPDRAGSSAFTPPPLNLGQPWDRS